MFYRAVYNNTYICIYYESEDQTIGIDNPILMFWKHKGDKEMDLCFFSDKLKDWIYYEKQRNQNIWKLIGDISNNLILEEPCLKDNNIDWFPEYMVKVDKIDYDKFNLPKVKKKYLKNPKKAPKVYE
ncbi:hypothetical protein [Tenacibaculum sp. SDUM215027]|uniref:hypothetical protein n=1 Tax=Tenacibaculum sp. SDUM215027 TaxID=3422596 RepID=UPI003D30F5D8